MARLLQEKSKFSLLFIFPIVLKHSGKMYWQSAMEEISQEKRNYSKSRREEKN